MKEIAKLEESFGPEDYESMLSMTGHVRTFYDDLRRAATNLAVVGLVTRLQHWVVNFEQQLRRTRECVGLGRRSRDSKFAKALRCLNEKLGDGPVSTAYFSELEVVRDSIIHGDSKAEWEFQGKPRRVSDPYLNAYREVELSEEQFKEAVSKAVQQVKWYDDRLRDEKDKR